MPERVAVSETPFNDATWSAEQLDAYCKLLSFNTSRSVFAWPLQHFPRTIHLGWHDTFNQMRAESTDQHERWTLIGVTQQRDQVHLPQPFARSVEPYEGFAFAEVKPLLQEAARAGIPYYVGDVHSHPDCGREQLWLSAHFSVDDLYDLVADHGPWTPQAMFLVHPMGTWAALRSQESDWLSPACRQEDFAWFWNWQRPEHERRAVNIAIAQCHHLALYEGGIDQPLSRVFL